MVETLFDLKFLAFNDPPTTLEIFEDCPLVRYIEVLPDNPDKLLVTSPFDRLRELSAFLFSNLTYRGIGVVATKDELSSFPFDEGASFLFYGYFEYMSSSESDSLAN